jgi:hypothetical protein
VAKKMKGGVMNAQARGEFILSGTIVIGAAGAITSTTGLAPSAAAGVTPGAVKTAGEVGRYSVALDSKYLSLRFLGAPALVGAADAAIGNTTGNIGFYRNPTTSGFDIQLALASTGADTEAANPTTVHWAVVVRDL